MRKKRVTGETKAYLGPARTRLFLRLANLGRRITTPKMADEFTQMSVADCREYVQGIERWFDREARKAGY